MGELTITSRAAQDLREGAIWQLAAAAEAILAAIEHPDRQRLPARVTDALQQLDHSAALLEDLHWADAGHLPQFTLDSAAHQRAITDAVTASLRGLADELGGIREVPDRGTEHEEHMRLTQLCERILLLHTIARTLPGSPPDGAT